MAEPADTSGEANDSLHLDRCPDCGYSLTGLPDQGICPECGSGYEAGMIVLYGRRTGPHANAAQVHGWGGRVFRGVMTALLLVLVMLVVYRVGIVLPALRGVPWGLLFLLAALVYRAQRARRDELKLRTSSQLRLSFDGFAQRDFIGPVELHPWAPDLRVEVKIRKWSINSLERRWPASRRRVRIRILRWKGRYRLAKSLVDFQFDCQEDAALQVGQQIEQWRHRAADAERVTE